MRVKEYWSNNADYYREIWGGNKLELKALVIDDSEMMRQMVMRSLRRAGLGDFDFVEAADGDEGLKLFDPKVFDIIFVDWNMPNMSGIDFVKAIRRLDGGEKLPIIMVMSERTMGKIEEAMDYAGATGFISKPFTEDDLYGKLKNVVEDITASKQKKPKGFFSKLMGA